MEDYYFYQMFIGLDKFATKILIPITVDVHDNKLAFVGEDKGGILRKCLKQKVSF